MISEQSPPAPSRIIIQSLQVNFIRDNINMHEGVSIPCETLGYSIRQARHSNTRSGLKEADINHWQGMTVTDLANKFLNYALPYSCRFLFCVFGVAIPIL